MLIAGCASGGTRAGDNKMLPSHGESQRTEQLLVGWLHDLNRNYHKRQRTPQPMSGLSNFQLQLFLCSFMRGCEGSF